MPTIRGKKNKKYQARWVDASGKKRGKTFTTRKLALSYERRKKSEVEEQRQGRAFGIEIGKTWEDAKAAYYARAPEKTRKDSRTRSMFSKYLDPVFAGLPLVEIRSDQISRVESAVSHLSPSTQRNVLVLVGAVLNRAHQKQWMALVPPIPKPKVVRDPTNIRFLGNLDEVARLLAAARRIDEMLFLAIALAAYTGMRKGEVAGLKWSDISIDPAQITIRRSYGSTTKSGKGRVVPFYRQLQPILAEFKLKATSDWVVPTRKGTMRDPGSRIFREGFHKALRAAGFADRELDGHSVPYLRFHDLRHTYASIHLAKGGDIFTLQRFLGHSSVTVTNIYAHLVPSALEREMSRMGEPNQPAPVIPLADRRSS